MMSSCACVRVLALQLLLIFGALLLVRLIDASSCYEQYCEDQTVGTDSSAVSLSCGSSAINVTFVHPGSSAINSIDLVCSHDLLNETVTVDLVCDPMLPDRFGLNIDDKQTVKVNVSSAGISAGSMCSFRGCFYNDFQLFSLISNSCVVARDCVWGVWSDWSECDSECGPGMQNRSRVVVLEKLGSGRLCEGLFSENRTCNSTVECTVPPSPITPTNATRGACNVTGECSPHSECRETSHGSQCVCLSGYQGNGSVCESANWTAGVLVIVVLVLVGVALGLGMAIHRFFSRKRRGLDHKRLEKLMGTFDPNFTPHLSTNLRKVTAVSELSVFDTLWLHSPPTQTENEYVTLDELGIHIQTNQHARGSDSEGSMELRIADYSDDEEMPVSSSSHTPNQTRDIIPSSSSASLELDNRSQYSLDYRTVQTLFNLGNSFQNNNYTSEDSVEDDVKSVESEPKDFVEDVLRIDIGEFSEPEEEERYMAVERETATLEQNDFVEGALRINIDEECDLEDKDSRNYLNVNVDGVCFTLPDSEAEQFSAQSKLHLSLSVLNHSDHSSVSLSHSSPLSSSTPSLFVS